MGWPQRHATSVGSVVQAGQRLVDLVEDDLDRIDRCFGCQRPGGSGCPGHGLRYLGRPFGCRVRSVRGLVHAVRCRIDGLNPLVSTAGCPALV